MAQSPKRFEGSRGGSWSGCFADPWAATDHHIKYGEDEACKGEYVPCSALTLSSWPSTTPAGARHPQPESLGSEMVTENGVVRYVVHTAIYTLKRVLHCLGFCVAILPLLSCYCPFSWVEMQPCRR